MRAEVNQKFLPEPVVTLLDQKHPMKFKKFWFCPVCNTRNGSDRDEDGPCEAHVTGWALLTDEYGAAPIFIGQDTPLTVMLNSICASVEVHTSGMFTWMNVPLKDVGQRLIDNERRFFKHGMCLLDDVSPTAWMNPEDDLPF